MKTQDIILKPIITENSIQNAQKLRKFTFMVVKNSTKNIIKNEIEKRFKVNVISVATSIVKGKRRKIGRRMLEVLQPRWKKAIVKLKVGQKIDLFDVGK